MGLLTGSFFFFAAAATGSFVLTFETTLSCFLGCF
jgi:hypothetical protein